MPSQWVRWNPTTHIYEISVDNGTSWAVLPLDGSILNQGTIDPTRLPNTRLAGEIIMWPVAATPTGWQLCDGSSLLRATFASLFAVIGTTYGSVDGTHFNVPDFRQRFPLGVAASGTGNAIAATGGSIDHTHTSPAHTHTSAAHTHTIAAQTLVQGAAIVANTIALNSVGGALGFYDGSSFFIYNAGTIGGTIGATAYGIPAANTGSTTPGATGSTTPGATGSNNPPFLAINFIIKT